MLKRFSDNLSRNVDADGLGAAEVLDAILRDEPYVFVRNVGYGENVLLLYRSESFRNRIMSGFFAPLDDVGAKAVALAAAGSMLPVHVNAMTYELLQELYAGQTVKDGKMDVVHRPPGQAA